MEVGSLSEPSNDCDLRCSVGERATLFFFFFIFFFFFFFLFFFVSFFSYVTVLKFLSHDIVEWFPQGLYHHICHTLYPIPTFIHALIPFHPSSLPCPTHLCLSHDTASADGTSVYFLKRPPNNRDGPKPRTLADIVGKYSRMHAFSAWRSKGETVNGRRNEWIS